MTKNQAVGAKDHGIRHGPGLFRSIEDAAARALVSATVTFMVGLVLKKMFERSVTQAAEKGAEAGAAAGS